MIRTKLIIASTLFTLLDSSHGADISGIHVNDDGKVGIGTDEPSRVLTVKGEIMTEMNTSLGTQRLLLTAPGNHAGMYIYDNSGPNDSADNKDKRSGSIWMDGNNESFHIRLGHGMSNITIKRHRDADGDFRKSVGIGTTSPSKGRLHVQGFTEYSFGNEWNDKPERLSIHGTQEVNTPQDNNSSIYATDDIIAKHFYAFSDARIKNVRGVSDGEKDLATLMQVEITDYTLKDPSQAHKAVKKVIGQQIRSVYPQAVNLSVDSVKDIMRPATIKGNEITFDKHGLKVGERINIVFDDNTGEKIAEVLSVKENSFTVDQSHHGKVMLLGREVKDFHNVDYEALSMLAISALQQVEREKQDLSKRVSVLEQKLERIEKALCESNNQTLCK